MFWLLIVTTAAVAGSISKFRLSQINILVSTDAMATSRVRGVRGAACHWDAFRPVGGTSQEDRNILLRGLFMATQMGALAAESPKYSITVRHEPDFRKKPS